MRFCLSILCLGLLTACAAPPPQLEDVISAEARASEFPGLIPLGPLSDIDALLPENPGQVGMTLEARAAGLRRRAAALQALTLR